MGYDGEVVWELLDGVYETERGRTGPDGEVVD